MTEDSPPFNMFEGNKVAGISTQILEEALHRTGIKAQFDIVPWARALALSHSQPQTCVYSAVRTPEREKKYGFKWIGPLVDEKIVLMALADSPIKLKKIADAKPYRVGGYVADARGDYIESQGVKVDRAPSDTMNLPKLVARRIDLWVTGSISGLYMAAREGQKRNVKIVISGGEPGDTQLWLACNTSVSNDVIEKLNTAVKNLTADGTANKFTAPYY
ncbi:substrate-binding periplasmic protein [Chitinimonas sp. BJB300]|uniref:substrate-binding periplasmic protein n=1 Tax=Chitinimonas sp. BJB300 TaxID=1559339 RepID=UPI00130458BC|nr:transporter substrate-binding domain-containing protein [Chitinimonas sp. BJB300]